MLSPKRTKFRKQQKGRMQGRALRGNKVTYGDYGLQAVECGYVTARQIEASRIAITRETKRGGRVWIKIFPDKPLTKKPPEVRQGSGKGSVDRWVAVVKPGRILFEIEHPEKEVCKQALLLAKYKLPVKTKIVAKEDIA